MLPRYWNSLTSSNVKDFEVTSLTFWGHVTSSVTWLLDWAYVVSYWWSFVTMHLSCTVTEIWGPKAIGVATLTFWGHVTSSISWPPDSAWALSMVNDEHASILHRYRDTGLQRFWSHEFDLLGSRDVIGHVTIRLSVGTFLSVVNDDHARILHGYGDTGLQKFWGHEFDLLGSRDVISHVTIRLGICGFLLVVCWDHASILNRYGDIKPQSCICPCWSK